MMVRSQTGAAPETSYTHEQRVAICSNHSMRADLTRKKNLRCEEVESPRSLAVRRLAALQGGSLLARRSRRHSRYPWRIPRGSCPSCCTGFGPPNILSGCGQRSARLKDGRALCFRLVRDERYVVKDIFHHQRLFSIASRVPYLSSRLKDGRALYFGLVVGREGSAKVGRSGAAPSCAASAGSGSPLPHIPGPARELRFVRRWLGEAGERKRGPAGYHHRHIDEL